MSNVHPSSIWATIEFSSRASEHFKMYHNHHHHHSLAALTISSHFDHHANDHHLHRCENFKTSLTIHHYPTPLLFSTTSLTKSSNNSFNLTLLIISFGFNAVITINIIIITPTTTKSAPSSTLRSETSPG